MKFSIGYRLADEEPGFFAEIVRDYLDSVAEVYFAWTAEPSGRAPLPADSAKQVEEELAVIKGMGVHLDLLLNANCYGDKALAAEFIEHVISLVGALRDRIGLDAVTTASPLIARTVRRNFPGIDVRASVNMRLGTVKAMSYLAKDFTSYCLQREFNRDPARLADLQEWADANGKQLHVLANSGCLNFCSAQTFHDNIVSHETAVNRNANVPAMATLCRELYQDPGFHETFLEGSWIRPEDIRSHSEIFKGGYKLATRMHDHPRLVIDAYSRSRFAGNLLDLMEPGFGPLFDPWIVDNTAFPQDWFATTLKCDKRCHRCGYCAETLKKVLTRI